MVCEENLECTSPNEGIVHMLGICGFHVAKGWIFSNNTISRKVLILKNVLEGTQLKPGANSRH